MIQPVNEKVQKIAKNDIRNFVDNIGGVDKIRNCEAKDVYEEYLKFRNENHSSYLGYINFRKLIMPMYDLDCIQVRIPETNERKRIFI